MATHTIEVDAGELAGPGMATVPVDPPLRLQAGDTLLVVLRYPDGTTTTTSTTFTRPGTIDRLQGAS